MHIILRRGKGRVIERGGVPLPLKENLQKRGGSGEGATSFTETAPNFLIP